MTGGLMQLVAYGAQDVYLTGNPQITFFKVVYRRHTNFSMESIEQVFNGTADFGKKVTATISRNGDLVNRVWVVINTPAGRSFVSLGIYRGSKRWSLPGRVHFQGVCSVATFVEKGSCLASSRASLRILY